MIISDKIFTGQELTLDGNEYRNCKFRQCRLIYGATGAVGLHSCVFTDCEWTFEGYALSTLLFLEGIFQGLGYQGQTLVDLVFEHIRKGTLKDIAAPAWSEAQAARSAVPA